jgi:SAM-dependent methyltransferase
MTAMSQPEDTHHPLFLSIYGSLPRQGPGSRDSTLRALSAVPDLGSSPRVLDVGCGSGAQTIVLAEALAEARITAVDKHLPFVAALNRQAEARGWKHRLVAQQGDMNQLDFPESSFDLIWSEGAIYLLGLEQGLRAWQRLLVKGGSLVVSHFCWLRPDPPQACRDYFEPESSDIRTPEANLVLIESCGLRTVAHFTLPTSDWWDDYYRPLEERLAWAKVQHGANSDAKSVLDTIQSEIDLYREHAEAYGYVFFVLQS